MLAADRRAAVRGIDAFEVTVEVDFTNSLRCWSVVGVEPLPLLAVRMRGAPRVGGLTSGHSKLIFTFGKTCSSVSGRNFSL